MIQCTTIPWDQTPSGLDLVGDELEPKLLNVMDDDEGELVVLR